MLAFYKCVYFEIQNGHSKPPLGDSNTHRTKYHIMSMKTGFADRLGQLLGEYCNFVRKAYKTFYEALQGLRPVCVKMHDSAISKSLATQAMSTGKPSKWSGTLLEAQAVGHTYSQKITA